MVKQDNFIQITCVGASMSSELIAIGDFGNHIHIFDKKNLTQKLLTHKSEFMVARFLKFNPFNEKELFIGHE